MHVTNEPTFPTTLPFPLPPPQPRPVDIVEDIRRRILATANPDEADRLLCLAIDVLRRRQRDRSQRKGARG